MRTIPLTQGKEAIVDDCDYEFLMQWKWLCCHGYAARNAKRVEQPEPKTVLMHRVIASRMGLDIAGLEIDHTDGNRLDNRRDKLRSATKHQNRMNKPAYKGSTSRYKGVSWHRRVGRWSAQIQFNNRCKHLGYFDNPVEAAQAYNRAAAELFGEYARLNPV